MIKNVAKLVFLKALSHVKPHFLIYALSSFDRVRAGWHSSSSSSRQKVRFFIPRPRGCPSNARFVFVALYECAKLGDVCGVKGCLSKGVLPDVLAEEVTETALAVAAACGHIQVVQALVSAGASVHHIMQSISAPPI